VSGYFSGQLITDSFGIGHCVAGESLPKTGWIGIAIHGEFRGWFIQPFTSVTP
jgi:hypothetical protein